MTLLLLRMNWIIEKIVHTINQPLERAFDNNYSAVIVL